MRSADRRDSAEAGGCQRRDQIARQLIQHQGIRRDGQQNVLLRCVDTGPPMVGSTSAAIHFLHFQASGPIALIRGCKPAP
jgi:hypothetical protein